ncbi:hypothetical protein [Streptomyces sp. NPDC047028]|uniref:hypothetical protein n=1 Tax=Streptomyces sp. NPDC047028 TaxID=3155793 RepID=UPI0033FB6208
MVLASANSQGIPREMVKNLMGKVIFRRVSLVASVVVAGVIAATGMSVGPASASGISLFPTSGQWGTVWSNGYSPDGTPSNKPKDWNPMDCQWYLWGGPTSDPHMHCYTVWADVKVGGTFTTQQDAQDQYYKYLDKAETWARGQVGSPVFRGSFMDNCFKIAHDGYNRPYWNCTGWQVFSYTSS